MGVKQVEGEHRSVGRSVEVLSPGAERDEWQLVMDGSTVAAGKTWGQFRTAVEAWQEQFRRDNPAHDEAVLRAIAEQSRLLAEQKEREAEEIKKFAEQALEKANGDSASK
jgi:hypothetical protein